MVRKDPIVALLDGAGAKDPRAVVENLDDILEEQEMKSLSKAFQMIVSNHIDEGPFSVDSYNLPQVNKMASLSSYLTGEKVVISTGDEFSQFYSRFDEQKCRDEFREVGNGLILDASAIEVGLTNQQYQTGMVVDASNRTGMSLKGFIERELDFESKKESVEGTRYGFSEDTYALFELLDSAGELDLNVYYPEEIEGRPDIDQRLVERGHPEGLVEGYMSSFRDLHFVDPVRIEKDYRSENPEDSGYTLHCETEDIDVVALDSDFLGNLDPISKRDTFVYTLNQAKSRLNRLSQDNE